MRKYGPFIDIAPTILGASLNKIRTLTALHSSICNFFSYHCCSCSPCVGIFSSCKNLAYISSKKVNNYEEAGTFFAPQVIYQTPHMCPYVKPVKQIKAIFFAIIYYTL